MQSIIKRIQKARTERRQVAQKLEALTDPHFFTIADFVRNFEFNTQRPATSREVQEVRALLCN